MSEKWCQLSYFPPERIEPERFPDAALHEKVIKTRQFFHEQRRINTIDLTDPFVTASVYVWQFVDYYPRRPESYYDVARGYLMVGSEDIPAAALLLDDVYRARKDCGKYGRFKWLMRKLPPDFPTDSWWEETRNAEKVGLYEDLAETDPRIVLYEDSPSDVQEILSALAALPEWQTLDENRRREFSGDIPPIRGTDRFTDASGRSWHSLSYNAKVGHSHEQ